MTTTLATTTTTTGAVTTRDERRPRASGRVTRGCDRHRRGGDDRGRRGRPRAGASGGGVATASMRTSFGSASVKGTVRKQNEDRYSVYSDDAAGDGTPGMILSVFDGHGGDAVSEWLKNKLNGIILEEWRRADFPLEALRVACLRADEVLVQPPEGFFAAFGERGVGGAKCGSTGGHRGVV